MDQGGELGTMVVVVVVVVVVEVVCVIKLHLAGIPNSGPTQLIGE